MPSSPTISQSLPVTTPIVLFFGPPLVEKPHIRSAATAPLHECLLLERTLSDLCHVVIT